MSKKPPKNGRLGPDDVTLWKRMTEDVVRREGADYADIDAEEPQPASDPVPEVRPVVARGAEKTVRSGGIDGRTEAKLRKGQIRPEARLDLHGMRQEEAHMALRGFIERSAARGLRCVLVITGKGVVEDGPPSPDGYGETRAWYEPKRGVLRERVPDWLAEPKMAVYVARFVEAQPKDGGSGALYVYLRRSK